MPATRPSSRARPVVERVLSPRPPLDGSALLGFTVFALASAVLPDVWLSWDLPDPRIWTAAFLVLLLLHAERPGMPRGAWLELWSAATVLATMHLSLLAWSLLDPVAHFAPGPVDSIPWFFVWGSVLALLGLLVTAAHRYRAPAPLVAALLSAALVAVLSGLAGLQDLEAVVGVVLCLYTALLAVRHGRGAARAGAAVPTALWLTVLLFAVFLVLNHPVAFRAFGVTAVLATTLVSWGCLGLLTAAVLGRARRVHLEGQENQEDGSAAPRIRPGDGRS